MANEPELPELTDSNDILAAEYVLRLLEGTALADAEARLESDAQFAADVDVWLTRLEPLFDEFADAPVAASVWARIEASTSAANTIAPPAAANDNSRWWKFATFASSAVAAALALVLLNQPAPVAPVAPGLPEIAVLSGDNPEISFAARFNPDNGQLRIKAIGLQDDAATAPELWVIPADGVPRSLGLIASTGTSELRIADANRALLKTDSLLAITLENPDTAPHAAPTSNPVAAGKLQAI